MIAILGSGNVATWIALKLRESKVSSVGQVYSRNLAGAQKVAEIVGAQAIDDLGRLRDDFDMYLFALKDDAYAEVLAAIPFKMPLALHTAGSVSKELLAPYADRYGVMYPLQTFSKGADMENLEVPLCLDLSRVGDAERMVWDLAKGLSDNCCLMSEEDRSVVHLAAVFACNFSNAMCVAADEIMREHNLDFKLLLPLLRQTIAKMNVLSPTEALTGPAARGDANVMCRHQSNLDAQKGEIYSIVSQFIISRKDKSI